jgi:hypothetical protein
MITKYHNRVEATEVADIIEADRIVREERAAGNIRFKFVPRGELKAELDAEALMDSLVPWNVLVGRIA